VPKKAETKVETKAEKVSDTPKEPMFRKRNDSVASDEDLAPLSGDIDERMASLLKDHQRMGARPK
jgi:hypothetical protein